MTTKKLFFYIFLLFIIHVVFIYFVQVALAFRVDEVYKRPIIDVNKALDGTDDYLCFAAAATNLLVWSYGVDAEETWKLFKYEYKNNKYGGTIKGALILYLTKFYTNRSPAEIRLAINRIYENKFNPKHFKYFILGSLYTGRIVFINLRQTDGTTHVLTVYGAEEILKNHLKLEVVDSDDKKTGLFNIEIMYSEKNNEWSIPSDNDDNDYGHSVIMSIASGKSLIIEKEDVKGRYRK